MQIINTVSQMWPEDWKALVTQAFAELDDNTVLCYCISDQSLLPEFSEFVGFEMKNGAGTALFEDDPRHLSSEVATYSIDGRGIDVYLYNFCCTKLALIEVIDAFSQAYRKQYSIGYRTELLNNCNVTDDKVTP